MPNAVPIAFAILHLVSKFQRYKVILLTSRILQILRISTFWMLMGTWAFVIPALETAFGIIQIPHTGIFQIPLAKQAPNVVFQVEFKMLNYNSVFKKLEFLELQMLRTRLVRSIFNENL